jgi:hypothetical protein
MNEKIKAAITRVVAADTNIRVEFNRPPNAEIQFIGRPPLQLNPATNNMTVPARFLHHPLVEDRYFCTLPGDFLDDVVSRVGTERFDPELVALETHLSTMCGDHSQNAGFQHARPFSYVLRRRPLAIRSKDARSRGLDRNQAALDNIVRIYEERVAGMVRTTRAYSGWLMTNPQFLGELDELLATWSPMVRRWGFDRLGIVLPTGGMFLPGDDPTADVSWGGYSGAFEQFFGRWRLRGMGAPYLPVPLEPLMSGRFPLSVLQQVMNSGGAFVLPDIYPVPSRDQLRGMLDDALHRSDGRDHLTEWMGLIAKDKAVKTPLIKFGRLFEVQHYCRLLHQRHAAALKRKMQHVNAALARFLRTTSSTIKQDLAYLKARLGPAWLERGRDS